MRVNTSTLFALTALFSLGSSLPFLPRKFAPLEPLMRRATYSVVPVDGGSRGPTTILKPTTITDTVLSTTTIEGPTITEVSETTLMPNPATVTKTYSIINVSEPRVTIVVTEEPSTSSSESSPTSLSLSSEIASSLEAPTITSESLSPSSTSLAAQTTTSVVLSIVTASLSTVESSSFVSVSTTIQPIVSSSSLLSAPLPTWSSSWNSTAAISPSSVSVEYTSTLILLTTTSTILTSTSTTSYDNGQWHTTYPAWSNGTATAATSPTATYSKKRGLLKRITEAM